MASKKSNPNLPSPYKDAAANKIYNMLFCDNLGLYKQDKKKKDIYPWDILLADSGSTKDLQKIIKDKSTESRMKILAYHKLNESGQNMETKDLLGVIVEVGLDEGLDVVASYRDGTARYINYTGKIVIWEATDENSNEITNALFQSSENIVKHIGPWDKARLPAPATGNVRISFLVSDALYFGEGPMNALFSDALAGPALNSALALMQYITEKALESE